MKKTASFETIDDYEVISAINDATIDPAATMEAIKPLIEALPETAQAKAITLQILAQQEAMLREKQAAATKRVANPNADITTEESRWNIAKNSLTLKEQELKPVTEAIETARIRLYEEAAVYCLPGTGQKILSEAEEADLIAKWAELQPHEALTMEGEVIPDYRGTEYHLKTAGVWSKVKIEDIGVPLPEGVVLPDDLTPTQREEIAAQQEADRLAALTPEQRETEKQGRLDTVADEADRLFRRSQIQGREFDTAAYYAEKSAEIEAKYA
ncbi:MAG: hypothetical protein LBF74_00835 [Treponema sp.]|jgi:hypothetical protein|nr:hypothetical protein [Treponema sp.]